MGVADQQQRLTLMVGEAVARYKSRDLVGAEEIYLKVLEQAPHHADALHLYGCLCDDLGRLDEAIALVTRATVSNPKAYPYFYNLGNMLSKQGRTDEAILHYRTAVHLKPDYAVAHNNLGLALRKQGKRKEAKASFQTAIRVSSKYADPHYNLCTELKAEGHIGAAIAECQEAIRIRPDYADAHFSLGQAYAMVQRPFEAVASYRVAATLQPETAQIFSNLGGELLKLGHMDGALEAFQEALRIEPTNPNHRSNLLLATSYSSPDQSPMQIQAAEWDRIHAEPLRAAVKPHTNRPEPERRLRIGYISADFRHHAVAYWAEPLLAGHQHEDFEIFCYSTCEAVLCDAVTARLKGHADVWVDCATLSDEALAARIREDLIDILVDLSGHTDGNRLLVFARQPAPVQVSWFGFPASTGLRTMHFRLTDAVMDPPGESEQFYSETLVRLSRFYAAFGPESSTPAVGSGPVARNGFVTYASLNSLAKITRPMMALWADILLGTPDSRLLLQAAGLDGEALSQEVMHFFATKGVATERLTLRGWSGIEDFLRVGQEADIALDPFPFNGGVTSCHALWMGLPVVTLSGQSAASRVGCSILTGLGLDELVAQTPEQYRGIALALATDQDRLASVRATLRGRMEASGLLDGAGLAREVEAAYRSMWNTRCSGPKHSGFAPR